MIPYDKRDGKREREKENEKKKLFIQGQKTQTNNSARGSWNDDDVLILLRVMNKV